MKAQIRVDALGDLTIHLEGSLDYEGQSYLKQELEKLVDKNPSSTITLDLHKMDFIGSSGIGPFVHTLVDFNKNRNPIKLINVKKEFLRIFKLYGPSLVEDFLLEKFENDNKKSFDRPFPSEKRTLSS